ncbi:MAG: RusA family crossover junction endodeoxyribonuclease [Planctomycetota bacterium]
MIKFTILGNPIAQKRHRSVRRGNFIGQYDPSLQNKEDFRATIQQYAPKELLTGPLRIDIAWFFARPKSHFGTGKNAGKLKASAHEYWHTKKPDRDNLDKFILDSLTGVFFKDDSIVCAGELGKFWDDFNKPRVEVSVFELDSDE